MVEEPINASEAWLPVSTKARTLWRIECLTAPLLPLVIVLPALLVVGLVQTEKGNRGHIWLPLGLAALGFYVLVALLCLFLVEARYSACRYRVTDTDVAVRYGVWYRNKHYVARHRIQHVDINAGPIARSLGLATLNIYVAGGRAAHVAGLSEYEAERIRQHLLRPEAKPLPPTV